MPDGYVGMMRTQEGSTYLYRAETPAALTAAMLLQRLSESAGVG